jgi:hypothetical protein
MDLKKQLGLACQTRNSSHKTEIIPYKKIKINYEVQFAISLMLKDDTKKK